MQIATSRFGNVDIEADDILLFSAGIYGFEECRHWVLLADADNDAVAWLQSLSRPDVAVPVVSPRRFLPGYQVRVGRSQLDSLELSAPDSAYVLSVLARDDHSLTINLRAPLIVNLDRRLGRQVVTSDEQPVAHRLAEAAPSLRKSA
ncbi:MAG: flagellar assembly protein FliW [Pirellulaceae bacterium]